MRTACPPIETRANIRTVRFVTVVVPYVSCEVPQAGIQRAVWALVTCGCEAANAITRKGVTKETRMFFMTRGPRTNARPRRWCKRSTLFPFLVPFSQFPFENFSRSCFRKALEEVDRLRALEARKPSTAKLEQLLVAQLRVRLLHNQCLWNLAPFVAGHRNHNSFVNRWVRGQHLFDFERRDVLAAADDDVLLPIDDQHVVVGIDRREIAGMEPSAFHRGRRVLG